MAERLSRREKGVSDFVPTNVAVNFVQHNRCNADLFHVASNVLCKTGKSPVGLQCWGDRMFSLDILLSTGLFGVFGSPLWT